MPSSSLESIQGERNALLRYALLHPPPGVTVKLPPNVKSIDECDLTSCPSPLGLYAKAEAAGPVKGDSKKKRAAQLFEYDLGDYLTSTFAGGGGGGIQRQGGSSSFTEGGATAAPPASPSTKSRRAAAEAHDYPGSAANDHSDTNRSSQPSSAVHRNPGGGGGEDLGRSAGGGGGEGGGGGGGAAAATAKSEEPPGALSTIVGALFGGGGGGNGSSAAGSANNRETGSASARAESAKSPPQQQQSESQPEEHGGGGGGGGKGLLGFLEKSRAHRSSSSKVKALSKRAPAARGATPTDRSSPASGPPRTNVEEAFLMLPLNGTSPGVLADHVLKMLEPFLDHDGSGSQKELPSIAGGSNTSFSVSGSSAPTLSRVMLPPCVTQPVSVKDPIVIEVCPIFDQSMLSVFSESAVLTVYEHLLIAVNLLLDADRGRYEDEILSVYRTVFNVSGDQHTHCVTNLIPAHLREGDAGHEALQQYIRGLRFDTRTLRSLINASSDDDFTKRMRQLLDAALSYSDEGKANSAGDNASYPLAIRASIYAVALIPIYRLDPVTEKPLYQPERIVHSVEKLRRRMLIPADIEGYCRLHARLLANDEGVTMNMQCTFLKYVASAVNGLSVRSLERERLTPSVKYAYYVLQETLAMAMAPMPWLESLCKTQDAMKSVSAVFIETCAVLPTCFLSASVRANGSLVLPPTCPNGVFIYALLGMFISSSTVRKFSDSGEGALDAIRSRCGRDRGRMRAAFFSEIAELDKAARDYCRLLQRSLPLSPYLALPARFGLAGYALSQQWERDLLGREAAAAPVPEAVVEDVWAMLHFLVSALPANTPPITEDKDMMLVVSVACTQYLSAVGAMVRRHDADHFSSLAATLEAPLQWSTTSAVPPSAEALPKDVARILERYSCPTLAPPLAASPSELQHRRLRDFVRGVSAQAQAFSLDLPGLGREGGSSSPGPSPGDGGVRRVASSTHLAAESRSGGGGGDRANGPSSAVGPAGGGGGGGGVSVLRVYAEYQRLTQLRSAQKPLAELLQRLDAVCRLQRGSAAFFTECASQYRQIMAVTGAPVVYYERLWECTDSVLADAISRLCEWIAAAILSAKLGRGEHGDDAAADGKGLADGTQQSGRDDTSAFGLLMSRYMKADDGVYKQQKHKGLSLFGRAKDKAGDGPFPKAYPQVTVTSLMAQLDDTMSRCVSGHPLLSVYRKEIRGHVAAYFVALLHTVYLEDAVEGVYLTPADAKGIIADLDAVSQHFFGARDRSATAPGTAAAAPTPDEPQGPRSGRARPAAHSSGEDSRGARMLADLCSVVRYVMMQPSVTLVHGGEGVPRLSTLPDFEENSPWCKYVVRRVLSRRKDKAAKQVISNKWFD